MPSYCVPKTSITNLVISILCPEVCVSVQRYILPPSFTRSFNLYSTPEEKLSRTSWPSWNTTQSPELSSPPNAASNVASDV